MEHPDEEMVWLGDLSGFRIEHDDELGIELVHRCSYRMPMPGDMYYLGNIVEVARQHTDCRPFRELPSWSGLRPQQLPQLAAGIVWADLLATLILEPIDRPRKRARRWFWLW